MRMTMPAVGSSPRMRGALQVSDPGRYADRIIPADAGSTTMHLPPRRSVGDHPRGCGEHDLTNGVFQSSDGSSPRMRGARRVVCRIRP